MRFKNKHSFHKKPGWLRTILALTVMILTISALIYPAAAMSEDTGMQQTEEAQNADTKEMGALTTTAQKTTQTEAEESEDTKAVSSLSSPSTDNEKYHEQDDSAEVKSTPIPEASAETEEEKNIDQSALSSAPRQTLMASAADAVSPIDFGHYNTTVSKLEYRNNSSDQWQTLSDHTDGLTPDTQVRITVEFNNIPLQNLYDAGGRAFLTLPEQFTGIATTSEGTITEDSQRVGKLSVSGNQLNFSFDLTWLEGKISGFDSVGSGSAIVTASLDWTKKDENQQMKIPLGDSNITVRFANDLEAQYGNLTVTKSRITSKLVQKDDGQYYLQYQLKVQAGGNGYSMPDVAVTDAFTAYANYIDSYVGIPTQEIATDDKSLTDVVTETVTDGSEAHAGAGKVYITAEAATADSPVPGTSTTNPTPGTLVWKIGEMKSGEVRTLTYWVKVKNEYTGMQSLGTLENTAKGYSKTYTHGTSKNTYTPTAGVTLGKTLNGNVNYNPSEGKITIPYKITITGNRDNDWTLTNLQLHDLITEYGNMTGTEYDENSFCLYKGTSVSPENKVPMNDVTFTTTNGQDQFSYVLASLAPGETYILTYNYVVPYEIYAEKAASGGYTVSNQFSVYSDTSRNNGNKRLNFVNHNETLASKKWDRKLVGERVDAEKQVTMTEGSVYQLDTTSGAVESSKDTSFSVPVGSRKYQVLVNEAGDWDTSSATMRDTLSAKYLQFTGYVQVDAYNGIDGLSGQTDKAVLTKITDQTPSATRWYKIDGSSSFSLKATDLGLSGSQAYVLTYYAKESGTDEITSTSVTNTFMLSGDVTGPNGKKYTIDGVSASVTVKVSGSASLSVEKQPWYYSFSTEAQPSDITYDNQAQSARGMAYWAVIVKGNIASGVQIQDDYSQLTKTKKTMYFPYAAVSGVYRGTEDAVDRALALNDMQSVIDQKTTLGLQLLDSSYFTVDTSNGIRADAVYRNDINSDEFGTRTATVTFNKAINLSSNEEVLIIFRTIPRKSYNPLERAQNFENGIYYKNANDSSYSHVMDASMTVTKTPGVQKNALGTFILTSSAIRGISADGTASTGNPTLSGGLGTGDISTDYLRSGKDNYNSTPEASAIASGNGTWAAWAVSVNVAGDIAGTATVSDILPEGLDPGYVRFWRVGTGYSTADGALPKTVDIPGLDSDGNWVKKTFNSYQEYTATVDTGSKTGAMYTNIYFWNPSTREIRMQLTGLQAGGTTVYHATFLVLTKVTDEKVLQSGATVTLSNEAQVLTKDGITYKDTATQTIIRKTLTKTFTGTKTTDSNGNEGFSNVSAPFELEVNNYSEDLNPEGSTITLQDMMNQYLIIDPTTVKITLADAGTLTDESGNTKTYKKGDVLSEGQYRIEVQETKDDSGQVTGQTVLITIPDNLHLKITYDATVRVGRNDTVNISNSASWSGYYNSSSNQVEGSYKFLAEASISTDSLPDISVRKLDATNTSIALGGAEYTLTEVTMDASGKVVKTGYSWSGITSYGTDSSEYNASEFKEMKNTRSARTYTYYSSNSEDKLINEKGLLTFGGGSNSLSGEGLVSTFVSADDSIDGKSHDLKFNQIYQLQETKAPKGYVLDSTPMYIVVARANDEGQLLDSNGNKLTIPSNVYVWSSDRSYLRTAYNRKGTITVNKHFRAYESDTDGTPVEGTYTFGLYEYNSGQMGKLLKTATVTYARGADGKNVGIQGNPATFTGLDFLDENGNGKTYVVRELDANGQPIGDGSKSEINGRYFQVQYDTYGSILKLTSDSPDQYTNIVNVMPYEELPNTGGIGTWPYLMGGGAFMSAVALLYLYYRKRRPPV